MISFELTIGVNSPVVSLIQDESTQVQLQLLTAIVKLFLKRPADTQELVQQVLTLATQVNNQYAIFSMTDS